MAKETEIKLRVSPAMLAKLREHTLLAKRCVGQWQTRELLNRYYDTADFALAHGQVALRIRRDGEQLIQTLKSKGASVAGLSERNEWDWYLKSDQLVLEYLDDNCWPNSLNALDKGQLQVVFSTDFKRQFAELRWVRHGVETVVEVALDHGLVIANEQQEEICEMELELRQGEPTALLELALELAADVPLMPCDISKAERGYRLFDATSYSVNAESASLAAGMSLDDSLGAIAWQLLGNSQRLAEQYRFNGHWKLFEQWLHQLISLRALLASLGQAAPRSSSSALRTQLDELIHDWRELALTGSEDQAIREANPERFLSELNNTRWGVFSLQMALWLQGKLWKKNRTVRGARQGGVALEKWVLQFLKDETQALQVHRYMRQPEDLVEQVPRLERVLVWLQVARHLIELVDSDRLFGSLRELHALALQPITDDVLDMRRESLGSILMLNAWKQLR
ncbi:CYTH domain-containing protein [Denitrificimonas sp. JX-1]|uniref:CYTH domain-containing protein n=1 Tax=Denitrificimonas halotolerans TaxID=3098930 RepID=A0ABU5GUP0_9GAMM|nr:CYTH domain-containing protein [Denitrificimonas sp. JX-1]MDY7219991.1 CYTH domain-containing protein [Denitrificimonas sp. JX-1]